MAKAEVSKDGEKTIKITISLDDQSTQPQVEEQPAPIVEPIFVDEARLFELANLHTVMGERNTEHGRTAVRLLDFKDETQRKKIIRMLGESFQQVVEQLVPYLFFLGSHPRATVRRRAAETVGEWMCELDFIRFKELILIPWALRDNILMNSAVGVALEAVAQDAQYEGNVKTLLKHWITSPNPSFNWTGVASCVPLGPLWPEETLEFLEIALKRDRLDLLTLAIFVVHRLCREGHAGLVMRQLSQWIEDRDANSALRTATALIFLEVIELPHVVGEGNLIDYAVDVFLVCLSDWKVANSGAIRSAMLERLKDWAEESFDDLEKQAEMEKLFTRLHVRAETQRDKDRIAFHIQRWRRKDDRFVQFTHGLAQD
jgi:hypothetical protein